MNTKKIVLVSVIGIFLTIFGINKLMSEPSFNENMLAASLNEFNFDLYRKVGQPTANIISSPYSVSSLLSMTAIGAGGTTLKELMTVLHLKQSTGIGPALDKINSGWLVGSSSFANALWGEKNLAYDENFLTTMHQSAYNHFYTVDYAKNPEVAREMINSWVAKNTKDNIKDLIPMNALTKETKLVLVNALYFRGIWQTPFNEAATQPAPFTLMDGKTNEVAMMNQINDFVYSENNLVRMLQLPYAEGNLAMAVLLPKNSLGEVQKNLNATLFTDLLSRGASQKVSLRMPKFSIDSTFDSLSETLQSMGLKTLFKPNADLSHLAKEPLWLSDVIQKARIQVDEAGTVAAAATGMVGITSVMEPGLEFIVDRPFVFMIFDRQSKIILFIGQVVSL